MSELWQLRDERFAGKPLSLDDLRWLLLSEQISPGADVKLGNQEEWIRVEEIPKISCPSERSGVGIERPPIPPPIQMGGNVSLVPPVQMSVPLETAPNDCGDAFAATALQNLITDSNPPQDNTNEATIPTSRPRKSNGWYNASIAVFAILVMGIMRLSHFSIQDSTRSHQPPLSHQPSLTQIALGLGEDLPKQIGSDVVATKCTTKGTNRLVIYFQLLGMTADPKLSFRISPDSAEKMKQLLPIQTQVYMRKQEIDVDFVLNDKNDRPLTTLHIPWHEWPVTP